MRNIFINMKAWFKYKCNRRYFKFIKACHNTWPWDWSYLLRLEQAKLQEMKSYFELTNKTFDHTNDIRWIGICIKLLDIIIDQPEDHPYINTRNMWRFIRPIDYVKDVEKEDVEQYYKSYPQDLRWVKAEHLYYEIRKRYTSSWWD